MNLQTVQIQTPPGFIDLGRGDPAFDLLPLDALRRAAEQQLARSSPEILQYGAEQGDGYFRATLAEFLSRRGDSQIDLGSLFVTSGISAGLDLVCTLLTRPGDVIFVEEPTYFLALRIFADHGLKVVSIRTDDSGLAVEELDSTLREARPKFLYVIPVFQNPGGRTLSADRRAQVLALAAKHDFVIVADEVYQFLNYGQERVESFGAHIDSGRVIALNSFSKILAPGLRLGWLQTDAARMKQFVGSGLLDSGGGMNPLISAIVRGVIESGALDENISKLVKVYDERVRAMDRLLQQHIPEAEFSPPHGGYFFWMRLPGVETGVLRARAQAEFVGLRQGALFSSRGGLQEFMRLSISFYDLQQLEDGIIRLSRCLHTKA